MSNIYWRGKIKAPSAGIGHATCPSPAEALGWPTAPQARPRELKLELTANCAHQLFLEASSPRPNTANRSGWNALLAIRQPFSHLRDSLLSESDLPAPNPKKKPHQARYKNETEQMVHPVWFFGIVFNGFSLSTKSFKIETSLAIKRGLKPRNSLIWPFRI